jgi:chemotaxis protein CheD
MKDPLEEFKNFKFHSVLPGDFKITTQPDEVISTLLGSCISACIRCKKTGIGGLNHFLLPSLKGRNLVDDSQAMRYGDYAMEVLIGAILRNGGSRSDLEAKIFGGANMFDSVSEKTVGRSNIQFVLDFINSEGISLIAEDIGGTSGRKIYFHPTSGKVKIQKLHKIKEADVKDSETKYSHNLDNKDTDLGTIELFG